FTASSTSIRLAVPVAPAIEPLTVTTMPTRKSVSGWDVSSMVMVVPLVLNATPLTDTLPEPGAAVIAPYETPVAPEPLVAPEPPVPPSHATSATAITANQRLLNVVAFISLLLRWRLRQLFFKVVDADA